MAKTVRPIPPPASASLPDAQAFGAWVRAARTRAGLSILDAAALCGVSPMFLQDLEHGKPTAHLGKALAVARQFGLDVGVRAPLPVGDGP
jgi:transcriptional regulator with XRE-family HTH domain